MAFADQRTPLQVPITSGPIDTGDLPDGCERFCDSPLGPQERNIEMKDQSPHQRVPVTLCEVTLCFPEELGGTTQIILDTSRIAGIGRRPSEQIVPPPAAIT